MKYIHLLYVPTMACNMKCKYCYLGDNTREEKTKYGVLETLKYAVDKFKESEVIPFNISLHGGEVTTLSKQDFHDIIEYISNYYNDNKKLITDAGFNLGSPHIKTNLYNINKHIDTIKEFNVSISGSLDLPLFLHDKFRVTKGNEKTLDKILKNVKLLNDIPNKKKVSATIFKEHYKYIDQIIDDIKYLDTETCLDMNNFNFMIGFDYNSNGLLHPLDAEEQLDFYNKMHEEFDKTNLDLGVNGAWFDEFSPSYCTNCDNCGEKFFLLERNGDMYSCVRGQKQKDYYYGNIYNNSVEEILNNARTQIFKNHNKTPFSEECANCKYLYLCKTGCPFVKNVYNSSKSYTCKLQQQLYKDRNYEEDKFLFDSVYSYVSKMHPNEIERYMPKTNYNTNIEKNLLQLIEEDPNLKYIYDDKCFILNIDGNDYNLESQIIKNTRRIVFLTKESKVVIYIKNDLLDKLTDYPQNNSVYIILLSGDMHKYGDEQRLKQKHIMSHQIYKCVLESNISDKDGYFCYDISRILLEYRKYLSNDTPNNLFFTTSAFRDYHYAKQKNNAFYHIQAINLPFQNIEFNYIEKEIIE